MNNQTVHHDHNPNRQNYESYHQIHNTSTPNHSNHTQVQRTHPPMHKHHSRHQGRTKIQKLTNGRTPRLLGLPAHACAVIATYDLLFNSQWIAKCAILDENQPRLVSLFARRAPSQYSRCSLKDSLNELREFGFNIEMPGDPFLALYAFRMSLITLGCTHNLLPILQAPCGQSDCPRILGDLQFIRDDFRGLYTQKNTKCAHCGHGGVSVPHYLPEEFYVRLEGRRWDDVDEPILPEFTGYKLKGLVQYNPQRQHFRCLRFAGPSTIVLDGEQVTQYPAKQDMYQFIHQSGWWPYMTAYSRKEEAKTPEYIEMTFSCGSLADLKWQLPQVCMIGGNGDQNKETRPSKVQQKTREFIQQRRKIEIEEIKMSTRLRMKIYELQQIVDNQRLNIIELEQKIEQLSPTSTGTLRTQHKNLELINPVVLDKNNTEAKSQHTLDNYLASDRHTIKEEQEALS